MGNKNDKMSADKKGDKGKDKQSQQTAPSSQSSDSSPSTQPDVHSDHTTAGAAGMGAGASSAAIAIAAPPPANDASVDPVVASLDKPLSRLPGGTIADIQTNPFGEKFKKTTTSLCVDDFELLKVVGKGSFGKVMQVRKRDTGKIYAMKVLKKQTLVARKQVAHTKTERKILEDIDHPFIVHLKFAFQTDTKLYMILEYFTGGELFFHLKTNGRFAEERAKFYAAEIVLALECLHHHTIVYRDLKPENVLLDADGHIRLTDFGLSKEGVTLTNPTHTFCGTPEYLAPEVIHGQGYSLPVDWWSLGTLLYEMLTGLPPFYNQNLHVMYEKIIRAKLHYPAYLSPEARSILSALLDRDPKTRLGSNGDANEVKSHPFFAGIDWEKLARKEVPTPFKPITTEGQLDTTNIDDEFKRETPKDTPVQASTLQANVNFPGFTFAAPDSNLGESQSVLGE